MKFHIQFDEKSGLFWMAASVIKEQHNERRHLGLFWSPNLENWVCAGLVASGCADNAARHYATLAIDGEDLLILSRSGDANACTAHNNNMQTLHRITKISGVSPFEKDGSEQNNVYADFCSDAGRAMSQG